MKKNIPALLIAITVLLLNLTSCAGVNNQTPSETTAAVTTVRTTSSDTESVSAEQTEAPSEITTFYSPDFKIELLNDNIKRVTDGDGRELILVPKSLGRIPVEYADSVVITTPVENAVFLSSTQVCTFRTVDDSAILDSIGGVDGGIDAWSYIPQLADRIASDDILDVTGGGMGEPDYEKIQSLNPDVVFVYTGEYGQQTTMAKLDELNINYAVDNEYLESSVLARMEWMRFILTFFNADEAADKAMSEAQARTEAAKAAVEGKDKPVIAMFSVFDGAVYATSDNSWVGSMISEAGGVNAFSGVDAGSLTMEAAYDLINNADVIVYTATPDYCGGMSGITDAFPQITECRAYENDRIYQYTDGFWYGIDQSDIMTCDTAAIIYPDIFADSALTYYTKLSK